MPHLYFKNPGWLGSGPECKQSVVSDSIGISLCYLSNQNPGKVTYSYANTVSHSFLTISLQFLTCVAKSSTEQCRFPWPSVLGMSACFSSATNNTWSILNLSWNKFAELNMALAINCSLAYSAAKSFVPSWQMKKIVPVVAYARYLMQILWHLGTWIIIDFAECFGKVQVFGVYLSWHFDTTRYIEPIIITEHMVIIMVK